MAVAGKIEAGHSCVDEAPKHLLPEVAMKYRIALHKSEEGYSVSVPGLPGCWSQGATELEAVENIRDAIREYLSVVDEQLRGEDVREIEVAV
jgi:predicted RNase H-like HicB family nuclease